MRSKRLDTPPRNVALAAILLAGMTAAQAAVVIVKDNTLTSNIPGLTGFATTGAMMDGLAVTATFSGGLTQTALWGTNGASSGAAVGTGWSLNLDGNTFTSNWNFVFDAPAPGGPVLGQLLSLKLDGSSVLTVLDTASGDGGSSTPGSAEGLDFAFANVGACAANACDATATYEAAVAITPELPVHDVYQILGVAFSPNTAPRANFSFVQDTDNDSRFFQTPEPGGLALAGLALVGLVASTRHRRG